MATSDAEWKNRCGDAFGDALDPERRAAISATLETLENGHGALLQRLSPGAEPAGHAGFLRSLAAEK